MKEEKTGGNNREGRDVYFGSYIDGGEKEMARHKEKTSNKEMERQIARNNREERKRSFFGSCMDGREIKSGKTKIREAK